MGITIIVEKRVTRMQLQELSEEEWHVTKRDDGRDRWTVIKLLRRKNS